MNTSVSILIYIMRAKVNTLGVCTIYTRVTINAKKLITVPFKFGLSDLKIDFIEQ